MAYQKHFLTDVILRVDFVTVEESIKEALIGEVRNIAVKHFPISEERKVERKNVRISNNPNIQNNTISVESQNEWHFFGKEKEKELCVAANCMFVNFKKYSSFTDFKSEFFEVFDQLSISYPAIRINRIGLRYIDQINIPIEKSNSKTLFSFWKKYINLHLLSGLQFADSNDAITRQMNTLEMNYNDHMLRFQYGIFNEDYPAPIRKNIFVLDTDIYATGLYKREDVKYYADMFHGKVKELFEKSIKQDLRSLMGEIK